MLYCTRLDEVRRFIWESTMYVRTYVCRRFNCSNLGIKYPGIYINNYEHEHNSETVRALWAHI